VPLLKDVAKYVRSKTAGPFWVTVDIFCDDDAGFERVVAAASLQPEAVAALYGADAGYVKIFPDANLRVLKISFPRVRVQGSAEDADSHAGQYFVPLLNASV
jgi:hypothetical protein